MDERERHERNKERREDGYREVDRDQGRKAVWIILGILLLLVIVAIALVAFQNNVEDNIGNTTGQVGGAINNTFAGANGDVLNDTTDMPVNQGNMSVDNTGTLLP